MATTLAQFQDLLTYCNSKLATSSQSFTISRARVQAAHDAAQVAIDALTPPPPPPPPTGVLDFSDPNNADNNGLL